MSKAEVIPKKHGNCKYEPWMCDKLIEVAQEGGHVAQMCRAIGVRSKDTFYRWTREHPEFGEAYEEARLISQDLLEQLLLGHATGKIKGNFNAVAMLLNNKFRQEYTRSATGGGTEINIGSINSIEHLDTDQLNKKLESKLKLLRTMEENETGDTERGDSSAS